MPDPNEDRGGRARTLGSVQIPARVLVMGLLGACMFVIAGLALAADAHLVTSVRVVWLVVAALSVVAAGFYVTRLLALRRR